MKKISILRRLSSSLVDKILILCIFLGVTLSISPYKMPGELGSYFALLKSTPSSYHNHDIYRAMSDACGKRIYFSAEEWNECFNSVSKNKELLHAYNGKTLSSDLLITGVFILVNFIYYLLGELTTGASFGKRLCNIVITSNNGTPTTKKEAIKRCLFFLLLMILIISIRFAFNTSYYVAILIYFFAVDIPVLIIGQSLIDYMTNTHIQRFISSKTN